MDNNWTKSERTLYLIAYGITGLGIAIFAVSQFVLACRSRPKSKCVFHNAKIEEPSESENQ